MNKSPYRAGIIGLGFIGGGDQVSGDRIGQRVDQMDGTHREALSANVRVALVAGSSRDEGRRERFQGLTGARPYADWREMLERERLDIVSVATFAGAHADLVAACAEQGVRVIYCEKPMATRLTDADRMLAACEKSGSLLVFNHNRRFNPLYRRLRDLVAEGGLGDLTSVYLQWGTGRLGNVGTHFIDAARMVSGREVEAVSATLDLSGRPDCRGPEFHDPGGWGVLRTEGGLRMLVNAPDYGAGPPQFVLNGTKGRAMAGGAGMELEWWEGRRESWPSSRDAGTSMDRAVGEIVAWMDADGQKPFPCSPVEALRTLEVIVGFHISHDRNAAWTELPLAGADREREVIAG
ncbi:MAG: Gfo/Idh/MocA family oxidoreductase [Candidatus Latescibacteria bacterium]|nr:Gfo/Idh/MocA family oxidoreductase [Candidatus Latescibacterota bacterium]